MTRRTMEMAMGVTMIKIEKEGGEGNTSNKEEKQEKS
jgi:hypothetical protein